MTVAQELSKMTPEVQNALLSAEGEIWRGDYEARQVDKNKLEREKEERLCQFVNCLPRGREFTVIDIETKFAKSTVNKYLTELCTREVLDREPITIKHGITYLYRWLG